jgi:hypothetical protein
MIEDHFEFLNVKPSEEPTFVEILKRIGDRIYSNIDQLDGDNSY